MAVVEGNTLQIVPVKVQIAKVQGMLAKISPKRRLSDELIAERRKEASLE